MNRYYFGEKPETDDEDTKNELPTGELKDLVDVVGNRVYYYGGITQVKSVQLAKLLQKASDDMQIAQIKLSLDSPPPIWLHINCYGGEVHASFNLADNIESLKVPVYTVVEGVAASGATIISTAGKKRYMRKNAHMLIHQLSGGHWGNWEQLQDDAENSKLMMKQLYDWYESRTKIKKKDLKEILKHDLYFPAEKCLELGLVDEII